MSEGDKKLTFTGWQVVSIVALCMTPTFFMAVDVDQDEYEKASVMGGICTVLVSLKKFFT